LLFFEVSPEVDGRDLGGSINIIIFRGGLDLIRKAVTGCSVVKPVAGELLVVLFSWLTIGLGAYFGADFGIDESITEVEEDGEGFRGKFASETLALLACFGFVTVLVVVVLLDPSITTKPSSDGDEAQSSSRSTEAELRVDIARLVAELFDANASIPVKVNAAPVRFLAYPLLLGEDLLDFRFCTLPGLFREELSSLIALRPIPPPSPSSFVRSIVSACGRWILGLKGS
jgi:hypothetical protein